MSNLTPVSRWDDVYQIKPTDPVVGGEGGTPNIPSQQLLNRTEFLKNALQALIDNPMVLSNAINSNAQDVAATSLAVKLAYEKAVEALEKAGDSVKKSEVSDAIDSNSSTNVASSKAVFDAFNQAVPTGSIITLTHENLPAGYLECNGATVSRSTFSDLFAQVGETYGAGNGSTTFKLPDYRGEFLRGWDNGRGIDAGRLLGLSQESQNKKHQHRGGLGTNDNASWHIFENTTGMPAVFSNKVLSGYHLISGGSGEAPPTSESGGDESRPRNVAVMYCIKY